jgi:hypothetical protein
MLNLFAYLVSDPTVKVNLGVPVTVIDSEKVTVNVGLLPGVQVTFEGATTFVIDGAVRSIVTVDELVLAAGPV